MVEICVSTTKLVTHSCLVLLFSQGTLPRKECSDALRKYGKVLISQRPEDTTRLLMELCIPAHDAGATETHALGDAYVPGY